MCSARNDEQVKSAIVTTQYTHKFCRFFMLYFSFCFCGCCCCKNGECFKNVPNRICDHYDDDHIIIAYCIIKYTQIGPALS